jgi:hypothetical protein
MSDFLLNLARRSGGNLPKVDIRPALVPYFPPTQGVVGDKRSGRKSSPLHEPTQDTSMNGTEAVSPLLDRSFHPTQFKKQAENPIELEGKKTLEPSSSLSYGPGGSFQAQDPSHALSPKRIRERDAAPAKPSPAPVRSDAAPQMREKTDQGATDPKTRTEVLQTSVRENELERIQAPSLLVPENRVPSQDLRNVIKPEKLFAPQEVRLENGSMVHRERDTIIEVIPDELQYQSPENSHHQHPMSKTMIGKGEETPVHPDPREGSNMHSNQETEGSAGFSIVQPRQRIIHEMEEMSPPLIRPAEISSIPTFVPVSTKPVTPPVRVHIGTVEVQAVTPPQPPPTKPAPKPEGFKDYLLVRNYLSREQLGY